MSVEISQLPDKVKDWLYARAESKKTLRAYTFFWLKFKEFCSSRGLNPDNVVDEYREAKYQDMRTYERFLDKWQDVIRAYYMWLKRQDYTPGTVLKFLAALRSFLKFWDIPLKVILPKHYYVVYHNRDLKKDELRQILNFANPRDRVIFLVLAESGMRISTLVNLKYWQIKEDFEAERIPMMIKLPSSSLKDHVGDRFTFIGEEGYRELRSYLERRMPLKDDDYVFISERKGKVKSEQFTPESISTKFNRLVQKLGIAKSRGKGKPKAIRLHSLRKYFRNNMRTDSAYVRFWMGHSLRADENYISRDIEEHRRRYAEGYKFLRIYEPSPETIYGLSQKLKEKDEKIQQLEKQIRELQERFEEVRDLYDTLQKFPQAINEIVTRAKEIPKPRSNEIIDKLIESSEFDKITDEIFRRFEDKIIEKIKEMLEKAKSENKRLP